MDALYNNFTQKFAPWQKYNQENIWFLVDVKFFAWEIFEMFDARKHQLLYFFICFIILCQEKLPKINVWNIFLQCLIMNHVIQFEGYCKSKGITKHSYLLLPIVISKETYKIFCCLPPMKKQIWLSLLLIYQVTRSCIKHFCSIGVCVR